MCFRVFTVARAPPPLIIRGGLFFCTSLPALTDPGPRRARPDNDGSVEEAAAEERERKSGDERDGSSRGGMPGHRQPRLYQSLSNVIDEEEEDEGNTPSQDSFGDVTREEGPQEPGRSGLPGEEGLKDSSSPRRISKTCVKNVLTVVLIFIYLLLTAVAIFLAYQTISDFLEKLSQPVMSVTYKEVDSFSPPGVALFPGNAQLLSCKHHYHDYIPALVNPGKPQPGDCEFRNVNYVGPFSNGTQKHAVVVRGPSDVRNKELIFMQFSLNDTQEDFSAITYMLFAKFSDLTAR
uniref:Proton-activated chloride channel n=1 Tax=Oryzias sinensis TaxID=183150 RepID=A0A8C7ZIF1_9TELE